MHPTPEERPPARTAPVVRRVRFEWTDEFEPVWSRTPELALSANAVSLLMPHIEPYVVDAVAGATDGLDGDLAGRARAFVRQERQHHGQHRRFNDRLVDSFPGLRHIERLMTWTFRVLRRRASPAFGVAFAAGFEVVAFAAARWTARRQERLFAGADPAVTSLFIWHLAEEVEHKSVAHDVYAASGGGRVRFVAAMTLSMLLLAVFTVTATMSMLWTTRRIFNPVAHLRMLAWSVSFVFDLVPTMIMASLSGHHPDRFEDPVFYVVWLRDLDIGEQTEPRLLDAPPDSSS